MIWSSTSSGLRPGPLGEDDHLHVREVGQRVERRAAQRLDAGSAAAATRSRVRPRLRAQAAIRRATRPPPPAPRALTTAPAPRAAGSRRRSGRCPRRPPARPPRGPSSTSTSLAAPHAELDLRGPVAPAAEIEEHEAARRPRGARPSSGTTRRSPAAALRAARSPTCPGAARGPGCRARCARAAVRAPRSRARVHVGDAALEASARAGTASATLAGMPRGTRGASLS